MENIRRKGEKGRRRVKTCEKKKKKQRTDKTIQSNTIFVFFFVFFKTP
jgi:hypothetical protein